MDIEKLIERLGENTECWTDKVHGYADLRLEAATALSTLRAENERLKDQLYDGEGTNLVEYWMQQAKIEENGHRNCQAEINNLQAELDEKEKYYDQMIDALSATDSAELEQVKQERDEAVQCIREIAKSGRVWMCPYCVHAKDTTGGIAECKLDVGVCIMPYSKFEWRGQKEE